jgi:hypothetical protein
MFNNTEYSIINKHSRVFTLLHHREVPAIQPYCSITAEEYQELTMPFLLDYWEHDSSNAM